VFAEYGGISLELIGETCSHESKKPAAVVAGRAKGTSEPMLLYAQAGAAAANQGRDGALVMHDAPKEEAHHGR
jgi:hypothetical protein